MTTRIAVLSPRVFVTVPVALAFLGLALPANAQKGVGVATPFSDPVRAAGVYHVATGTWTRSLPNSVSLGPDVIYNNTGFSGLYSDLFLTTQQDSFAIVDSGRIPSASSGVPGVDRDTYTVSGIEIGYCVADDAVATGPLTVAVKVYHRIEECEAPDPTQLTAEFLTGPLPGTTPANVGTTNVSCWTVQLDLTGSEFCLFGDGEGTYQGDTRFDSFGLSYEFDPGGVGGYVGQVAAGPIMAGDRDWTAQAPGELIAGGLSAGSGGGGGTYFGPAETCIDPMNPLRLNSSGYDCLDQLWVDYQPSSTFAPDCYWFFGYSNPAICNADGSGAVMNVYAGIHAALYAEPDPICDPTGVATYFCAQTTPNSSGNFAHLLNTPIPSGSGLHLDVEGGPPGEFGYYLVGSGVNPGMPLMISNGLLCLDPNMASVIGRYNVVGGELNSVGQFNVNGDLVNLAGNSSAPGGLGFDVPQDLPNPLTSIMSGETWHFQVWYRDTPAGQGQSNMTNGLSVTF